MSLHITPPTAHPTTHHTPHLSAPSAPGLPDKLRTPASSSTSDPASTPAPQSSHPLESRLLRWKSTRDELKMVGLRRTYGLAEPLRREQELSSVRAGDGMGFTAFRTEKSVSEEILRGEEAEVGGWEGVFGSGEELREGDFHGEMEAKAKMNW